MTNLLIISIIIFFIGICNCVYINNKNLLLFILAAELMFFGLNLMFICFSYLIDSPEGLIFSILILMFAVGDSVVALGLVVVGLKSNNKIDFVSYKNVKD